jgi:hypothetical protein
MEHNKPRYLLRPRVTLYDMMLGTGNRVDGIGCELSLADLPFESDPAGAQLPEGKAMYTSLTSGELWILAGGHDGVPLQCFAAAPVNP